MMRIAPRDANFVRSLPKGAGAGFFHGYRRGPGRLDAVPVFDGLRGSETAGGIRCFLEC